MRFPRSENIYIYGVIFALFLAAMCFRPPLPIDETRYLTVAWEMFLRRNYFLLTMNFELYHQKPPLLFWLINGFWQILGVHRWSAALPALFSSAAIICLTGRLAHVLFPDAPAIKTRARWIMLGSLPFLTYGSLIMFDSLMTVWVLAAMLIFLKARDISHPKTILAGGLIMGLGVLTKGPVAYLYIMTPLLLGLVWSPAAKADKGRWYGALILGFLISVLPVLSWLIPAIWGAHDGGFAFWLLWKQTSGRIVGNFKGAHVKPFYFYALLAPAFALPWILFPSVWRRGRNAFKGWRADPSLLFLICWLAPVFLAFSAFSGKQPHYLFPLVPALVILFAYLLKDRPLKSIRIVAAAMVSCIIIGQGIAAKTLFPKYDLTHAADILAQHPEKPVAIANEYHGEFNFLARLTRPVAEIKPEAIHSWLRAYPDGLVIARYADRRDFDDLQEVFDMDYRAKNLGIFAACPAKPVHGSCAAP